MAKNDGGLCILAACIFLLVANSHVQYDRVNMVAEVPGECPVFTAESSSCILPEVRATSCTHVSTGDSCCALSGKCQVRVSWVPCANYNVSYDSGIVVTRREPVRVGTQVIKRNEFIDASLFFTWLIMCVWIA